ncbi:MAG: AAA family ATPase [Pseudomonadota bacterium]|nr:AAA family ATPase [Pseudomonadota bacterium]
MADAVSALREALAFSPDNVPLRMHLARTLLEAGRWQEAASELREVLLRAPDRADARLAAGTAASELGDDARVVEHWWPVRDDLDPEDLRDLARAAVRSGARDRAQIAYDELLARDPALRDLELDRALRMHLVDTPAAEPEPPPPPRPARPAITFADVGGLESLKERLRMDIIYPLQRPDLFRAYGKKVGGGVLLFGPPGVGKTHLARAAAGECEASFVVVEIQQVLDMWLGESEKRLHQIFEKARDEAPTILFFDEIEAIGAARHQLRHGPGRRMVNQLLTELDGVGAANDRVLVLGATNAPWDVDPALRRPGRFDRVIFVPPPDVAARAEVLKLAFRDRPVEGLDLNAIARRTARYSGADLVHLAEVASERALSEALRSGKVRAITQSDVLASVDRVRPTTVEWLDVARRYVTYANQAGLYDDVARYLEKAAE